MTPPRRVLFVCLHGSAKSLIALEHFRRLAAERGIAVEAAAAGTAPDAEIPPHVVQGLLGDGIDVRARRPRQVTLADLETASREHPCPIWVIATSRSSPRHDHHK